MLLEFLKVNYKLTLQFEEKERNSRNELTRSKSKLDKGYYFQSQKKDIKF
jgi:hypothetical protein